MANVVEEEHNRDSPKERHSHPFSAISEGDKEVFKRLPQTEKPRRLL